MQNETDRLRAYQARLVDEVMTALEERRSVALQLPTGGGKTHIAVEIAKRATQAGFRVWFVCHRREILKQTSASFEEAGVRHGMLASGAEIEPDQLVQLCSVGSLLNRLSKVARPDLVIWDECHHVAAKSWTKIKESFPQARHLGLTATPARLDGKGLQGAFAHLICGPSMRSLIKQGYLSEYRLFAPTIPDLRGVKVVAGDYDKSALGEAMSAPVLVGDAVDHYKRLAPNARAIVFASSVRASEAVAEKFKAAGIPSMHVDATTRPEARDAAVAALASGEIRVLSNVELFTEGFDLPAIDAVILLRPTKSLALYLQMIGRGLRTAAWKRETLILDHGGLIYEHGLPDDEIEWSLGGYSLTEPRMKDGQPRMRRCPDCTAVHAWAAECVECGREYGPADRTIEEVYGELVHYSPRPRAGYETQVDFGRRAGLANGRVHSLIKIGLPADEYGFVHVAAAQEWLSKHLAGLRFAKNRAAFGFETQKAFASRIGYKTVNHLVKIGLPTAENGTINIEVGLKWIEEHRSKTGRIFTNKIPDGCETANAFANRVGRNHSNISSLRKKGLPSKFGYIDIEPAILWLKSWQETQKTCSIRSLRDGTETIADFARRIGKHRTFLFYLKKKGLPVLPNATIEIESGLAWFENWKKSAQIKKDAVVPMGYERLSTFGKRFGISYSAVTSMVRRGMPSEDNGTLNINSCLEWMNINQPNRHILPDYIHKGPNAVNVSERKA